MRAIFWFSILLTSCDILPQTSVLCAEDSRCNPYIDQPFVLGKPNNSATTASTMGQPVSSSFFKSPISVARAGNRLIVLEDMAHRALIYPMLPTSPHDRPNVVLGQSAFDKDANPPGDNAASLNFPYSVSSDGTVLAIADTNTNRILIWNSIPTQNQQPADLVLGQINLNRGSEVVDSLLNHPESVFVSSGRIYVADTRHHRVLIWKKLPTENNQPPDIVLGQVDLQGVLANRGGAVSKETLNEPSAITADASSIYVSDTKSNRVLVWKTLDPPNGAAADLVIGQPTGEASASSAASASSLSSPIGLSIDRNRLFVADSSHNRVLMYNLPIVADGPMAIAVFGQPNLTSGANPVLVTATSLDNPTSVLATEVGLYIADQKNGRLVALPRPQ